MCCCQWLTLFILLSYLTVAECEALRFTPSTLQYLKTKKLFLEVFPSWKWNGIKVANIVLPVFLLLFLKWIMQVDGNVQIKTCNEFLFLFFVCLLNCFDLHEEIKIWPFLFSRFLWTTFSWLLVWRTLLKMLVFSSLRPSAEFTSASASG